MVCRVAMYYRFGTAEHRFVDPENDRARGEDKTAPAGFVAGRVFASARRVIGYFMKKPARVDAPGGVV